MLNLPNVTLLAVTSKDLPAHKSALEYSCKGVHFSDVKLVHVPGLDSIDKWNEYIFFNLHQHVETEFGLLIHPDGFVVNPISWDEEFLNYDYIGAPWPLPTDDYSYRDKSGEIIRVGNSVSIRSKRLMELPSKKNLIWESFHGFTNEDGAICVNYRHEFVNEGMTFAPLTVAARFSRELPIPENQGINPFCFHRHIGENSQYPKFI